MRHQPMRSLMRSRLCPTVSHYRALMCACRLILQRPDRCARFLRPRQFLRPLSPHQPASVAAAPPRDLAPADKTCTARFDALLKSESVYFNTASSDIAGASNRLLKSIADVARGCPQAQIEIVGHTDNRGDPERNKRLSQTRARAIADYLAKAGIAPARLSATGFGEEKPIASNATEAGRARNRRAEIHREVRL